MCGLVGYIGPKHAPDIVVDGLKALEYRGYDSAGIAVLTSEHNVTLLKEVGRVNVLEGLVDNAKIGESLSAIGHTRWATHGGVTMPNAHPHANTDQTIFVVHNGIIENHNEIRKRLEAKGYKFVTETDTETVPQLMDYYYHETGSFEKAFEATIHDLRGAYAIVALTSHEPEKLFAAKLSSPLVLGVGEDEMLIASDPNALLKHTKKVLYLTHLHIKPDPRNGAPAPLRS